MSGVVPDPIPIEHIHRIIKTHDEWKYSVRLTVGPSDARWELTARGDVLDEVMKDIDEQRAHLAGTRPMEKK